MIFVIGIDTKNPNPNLTALVEKCSIVFASKRFQPLLKEYQGRLSDIVPLAEVFKRIKECGPNEDVAILASGDPLFFGIGRRLLKEFSKDLLTFYPALTTVQKACAKFKLPWDNMDFVSLHGKGSKGFNGLVEKILTRNSFQVAVFTDTNNSPDVIAKRLLEKGLNNACFHIAEDIGGSHEAFKEMSIEQAADNKFHALNLLLITGHHTRPNNRFGIHEDYFESDRGLITKAEVRSVILSKLELPSTGVFWDIGAGSGSISLESSLLSPGLEIYCIERNVKRCEHIWANRKRFLALNIEVIPEEAPSCLKALPRPNRIFIGGGVTSKDLLEKTWEHLEDEGILVVSTILVESLERMITFAKSKGLEPEMVQVSVCRGKPLGNGTYFAPSAPISVFKICKKKRHT